MNKRGLLGPAVVLLLAVGCSGSGGSVSSGPAVTGLAIEGPATPAVAVPPATPVPTTAPRPHDKGFTVLGVQLQRDYLGFLGGTVEVENVGGHRHSAALTFTFTQQGHVIGKGTALVRTVGVGEAVSAEMSSTFKWDGAPLTYSFQVSNLY